MTADPIAHLDPGPPHCQIPGKTPCQNTATHAIRIHDADTCKQPHNDQFGNSTFTACYPCTQRIQQCIRRLLDHRLANGITHCRSCHNPMTTPEHAIRGATAL